MSEEPHNMCKCGHADIHHTNAGWCVAPECPCKQYEELVSTAVVVPVDGPIVLDGPYRGDEGPLAASLLDAAVAEASTDLPLVEAGEMLALRAYKRVRSRLYDDPRVRQDKLLCLLRILPPDAATIMVALEGGGEFYEQVFKFDQAADAKYVNAMADEMLNLILKMQVLPAK